MSGRNTPIPGAGPRRSSRFQPPLIRRRTSSLSAATTSSANERRGCRLAEWNPPSVSDFRSSRVPTPNFDSIGRILGELVRRGMDSNYSVGDSTNLTRPTISGSPSFQVDTPTVAPMLLLDKPLPLTPVGVDDDNECDDISRPVAVDSPFIPEVPVTRSPLPRRRAISMGNHGARQSLVTPIVEVAPTMRVVYDRESRRLTVVEGLQDLYPGAGDPLASLEIPCPEPEEDAMPPNSSNHLPYKQIIKHIVEKLESLALTAKARIPKAFKLVISTAQKQTPGAERGSIGLPFAVDHTVEVTVEPKGGKLFGMPEEWISTPSGSKDEYYSQKGESDRIPASPTPSKRSPKALWGLLRRQVWKRKESAQPVQRTAPVGKRRLPDSRPPLPELKPHLGNPIVQLSPYSETVFSGLLHQYRCSTGSSAIDAASGADESLPLLYSPPPYTTPIVRQRPLPGWF